MNNRTTQIEAVLLRVDETLQTAKLGLEDLLDTSRSRRMSGLRNPGVVEPVGEGVSELKIDYGPGYRVYFIQRGSRYMLLLIGGDKSTQARDIRKAKELARKYSE